MSKLSKITIASIAIAATAAGTIYLTSASGNNNTAHNKNKAVVKETNSQTTLVSVWDKETEPNYLGTTEMTVYRSPSCGCCGVWVDHAKKHGFKIEELLRCHQVKHHELRA